MSHLILFMINGLGLGNSTRCHAILQKLAGRDVKIEIITSGNGIWYFGNRPEVGRVHEIEALQYGKKEGKISILSTIGSIGTYAFTIKRNSAKIASVIESFKPDVVVMDSVYSYQPMKKAGIPIIGLNNADVIYHSFSRFADKPRSIYPQFYCVEVMDYLFHRKIADLVLSPSLDGEVPETGGKFKRIGGIARTDCIPLPVNDPPKKVVIMLSGSVFGSPVVFSRASYPFHIDVVGRPAPDYHQEQPGVVYHGKILNTYKILRDADLFVINGGFSAINETFRMQKPMVVIPVPRHAEQWINGRTIQQLGVGMMAEENDLENAMFRAVNRIGEFKEAYRRLPDIRDGAEQAAELILETARNFRQSSC